MEHELNRQGQAVAHGQGGASMIDWAALGHEAIDRLCRRLGFDNAQAGGRCYAAMLLAPAQA
jgi:hypothetical protein